MTSREAFEAWKLDVEWDKQALQWRLAADLAWQAAWEARGKHDAEVCRAMAHYTYTAKDCAQAIEEHE